MKKNNKIFKKIIDIAFVLEIILAILVIFGILIGVKDIILYLFKIYRTGAVETYDVFKQFLAHVLLLVVGVELVLMLVSHSIDSVTEFILFVIARKMLIYSDTMLDLLLGTVSFAILFLTIKYFAPKKELVRSGGGLDDDID